jgi:hypothetical protein
MPLSALIDNLMGNAFAVISDAHNEILAVAQFHVDAPSLRMHAGVPNFLATDTIGHER